MKKINVCIISILVCSTTLSAQNRFIIEPYIQQPTNHSINVLWETSEPSKAIAFLAEAKHNTLHPDFTVIRQNSKAEKMHTIQYEGLSRGTQYIYQIASVIGSDTLWGPISRFDISDYKEEPIVCIVFGDTQRNPSLLEHFAGMFAKECPSFLLHIGDLVESGHNKKCWTDEFFYPLRDLLRFYPLYPVLGNHEGNTPFYYQYFDLPEPEWFYTQKKGNALFVFVNTNLDILPGSKQYQMLEKTLALSDEQWKIVIHHHPVYVSSGYYDLMTQKVSTGDPNLPHLRTLYDTYGVDVVYNGHIHNYERTMPIYQGRIDIAKGVTYITAGGGGGRLDDTPISRTWFMAEAKSKHHYIKMKIWDRTLSVYAIDSTGITFDHWEKVKNKVDLSVPLIESNELCFLDQTQVTVKNSNPDSDLVIQVNGSYHSTTSEEIQIILNETTVLTAFVKNKTGEESRPVTKKFTKLPLMNAHKKRTKDKIKVEYYEGFYTVLPDFDKQKPLKTFEVDTLSLDVIKPRAENHWAARSYGRFTVAETKVYRILLESYDGSRLLIDGKEIINNDGMHYEIRMDNYVALEKGEHTFEVQYFDFTRRETLRLWMNPIYSDLIEFNEYIR